MSEVHFNGLFKAQIPECTVMDRISSPFEVVSEISDKIFLKYFLEKEIPYLHPMR